jgi:hypothetical protein
MGLLLLLGDSGFRGALDALGTGLESAWSVGRRLRTAYSRLNPVIRVRRSSDNAESDFAGLGTQGQVDTAAVAAFCGAGDGFLTTIYDQSGNGRNFTQATTSVQPIVCESGTAVTLGGRLAAKFVTATSHRMTVATSTALYNYLHTTGGTIGFVNKTNDTVPNKWFMSNAINNAYAGFRLIDSGTEDTSMNIAKVDVAGVSTNGDSVAFGTSVGSTANKVGVFLLDPDNATASSRGFFYRNGTSVGSANASTGTPFVENAAYNLHLGLNAFSTGPWDGNASEIVIWSNILSDAQRDAYEASAGAFYGITVA